MLKYYIKNILVIVTRVGVGNVDYLGDLCIQSGRLCWATFKATFAISQIILQVLPDKPSTWLQKPIL
jgi:hypothetical protein